MPESRPLLTDPAVLETLAHPVRLGVLSYLMSEGPASASDCARAIGDSPSNCSYHLRTLARHGFVEAAPGGDGRTRPWRATITGFALDPDPTRPPPAAAGPRRCWRPRSPPISATCATTSSTATG